MSLDESRVGEFPQKLFGRLIIVAEFPRAAEISENLRYVQFYFVASWDRFLRLTTGLKGINCHSSQAHAAH